MKVLVIEDYEPLCRSLTRGLREGGYAVDFALDGQTGLEYAETAMYDVIVLDLMLPKMDGLALLERMRRREVASKILVLTARGEVESRVRALNMGADDYMVKPFAFEELLARVRALQRRRYRHTSPVIKVGDLEVDTSARIVRLRGEAVELTAREYSILEVLALRRGQIVTRDEICGRIYDFADERSSNVIDVYIGYLRKKLSRDDASPLIQTRRGLGFILEDS